MYRSKIVPIGNLDQILSKIPANNLVGVYPMPNGTEFLIVALFDKAIP